MACWPKLKRRQAKQAFTLVELLVVIAIIVLLVSIVLPQINNALFRGKLTATAANGRSIHQSIFAKESESVYTTTSQPWPAQGDYANSALFFKSLVTNGTMNVSYRFFAAPGIPSAADEDDFDGTKCAWNVAANITSSSAETLPVIFTRNMTIGNLNEAATLTADPDGTPSIVADASPFNKKGFVFVTKGGAAFALFKDDMKLAAFESLFNVQEQTATGYAAANKPILKAEP